MHLMHICKDLYQCHRLVILLYRYDKCKSSRWHRVEHTTLQMYSFSTVDRKLEWFSIIKLYRYFCFNPDFSTRPWKGLFKTVSIVTYHAVHTLTKQCTEHQKWPGRHWSSRVPSQSFVKSSSSCFPASQWVKSLLLLQFLSKKNAFLNVFIYSPILFITKWSRRSDILLPFLTSKVTLTFKENHNLYTVYLFYFIHICYNVCYIYFNKYFQVFWVILYFHFFLNFYLSTWMCIYLFKTYY